MLGSGFQSNIRQWALEVSNKMLGSGQQSNVRQWPARRGCFLMRPWGLHGGISGSQYHQYLSIFSISISLGADTINIRSEKKATRAPVTQYGMTLGWNLTTKRLHGGLMMCLQDEAHMVQPSFCLASILEAGWPIKPFNQWFCTSVIVGGPTQIISLPVSIDNNNLRIEQWARLNPLIIPSTHDDPIFFWLWTKRWRGMTWQRQRQRQGGQTYVFYDSQNW